MQKYTAIILASRDTNEFDRIYTLYTKEAGLVRVAGRGVRKPEAKLAGHLEPGTMAEIYVARSKGMGQITGAITLESFEVIKKDFEKLSEFLKVAKFFLKNFAEGEKDEKIFELFDGFLKIFADKTDGADIITEAFWWKLFDLLGHRPEMMKCVSCGKKLQKGEENFWNVSERGVVCEECAGNGKELPQIHENEIKLVRLFLANSLGKILKVKSGKRELERLEEIRKEFNRYNF